MENQKNFQDRFGPWAVIAGASEGLGAAFAEKLAGQGLNLVLIARREEMLNALAVDLAQKYSIQVKILPFDLSQPESTRSIIQETAGIQISLLIYNAGLSIVGPFLDHSIDDHLREIETNIRAPLILTHHFGSQMLARGRGGIILMASLSAYQGSAYIANYAATKAFNIILAEGLWDEWRTAGVDMLVCAAGAIRTPKYIASAPKQSGRFSDATLVPEFVAGEALKALGKQPFVIPGRFNQSSSFIMRHLLPRRLAIQMMGKVLKGMYT